MGAWFITFEGLDGSGKSTHLSRAARWLGERGVACEVTHEPGGTEIGRAIRAIFLDDSARRLDGIAEALLLFAARRQHLVEVIEPALRAGRHVLCDRFTDSTVVYQGRGRGVPLAAIEALDRLATGGRVPDRTLLFDVPASLARERGGVARTRPGAKAADRFDAEDLAFYERLRTGYLDLAVREPSRVRVLDASGPPEETERQVRAALADLVPEEAR